MSNRIAIRYLYVNDDRKTYTVSSSYSYFIFKLNPLKIIINQNFEKDYSVSLLSTSCGYRYITFCGLIADPNFNTKDVVIFDHFYGSDEKSIINVKEIFKKKFDKYILSLKLSDRILMVGFHDKIELFDFTDGSDTSIKTISIGINVLCPLCISSNNRFILHGGAKNNEVVMLNLENNISNVFSSDDSIASICMSNDQNIFATVCSNGKSIYVWYTGMNEKKPIIKLIRGKKKSIIHSVAISPDNSVLAAFSQNGTLHFFDIKGKKEKSFSKLSFKKCNRAVLSWQENNKISIATYEGSVLVITLSERYSEIGREYEEFSDLLT